MYEFSLHSGRGKDLTIRGKLTNNAGHAKHAVRSDLSCSPEEEILRGVYVATGDSTGADLRI
jgi:hypothetical protein